MDNKYYDAVLMTYYTTVLVCKVIRTNLTKYSVLLKTHTCLGSGVKIKGGL